MTQSKRIELTNKWMQVLGFINEEEHKSFNKVIRSFKEIQVKDFQYKITNKILVTKSFLHKINKVDNNICEYCNLQPETIYHLFIECEIVKRFWNELRIWLSNNSTVIIELGENKFYSLVMIKEIHLENISALLQNIIYMSPNSHEIA